jgi:hypothetical protein
MNWKVKVTIGEVSAEMEIPLSQRSHIELNNDGTAGKTLDLVEKMTEKLLKVSLEFENGKPKTLVAKKFVRSKS